MVHLLSRLGSFLVLGGVCPFYQLIAGFIAPLASFQQGDGGVCQTPDLCAAIEVVSIAPKL